SAPRVRRYRPSASRGHARTLGLVRIPSRAFRAVSHVWGVCTVSVKRATSHVDGAGGHTPASGGLHVVPTPSPAVAARETAGGRASTRLRAYRRKRDRSVTPEPGANAPRR